MSGLRDRIARLIETSGPISVAQYMTLALHDPKEGYYATHDPLGAGGDFITAPEISQMFGELIGLWFAQCWADQGQPVKPVLIEMGPGRGTLMSDMLRALEAVPHLREQIAVYLVEASPTLKAVQAATLKDCGVPVHWAGQLEAVPDDRAQFIVANEFFDALPIRQFVKREQGWHERMVAVGEDDALVFVLSPVPALIAGGEGPIGAVLERSAAAEAIAGEIGRRVADRGGAALIVDYGPAEQQLGDTLQALKQHRHVDVLAEPGAVDLTAHVDFAALRREVERAGAAVFGPLEQGDFLRRLGIEQRAARLGGGDTMQRQVQRLIAADQMGSLFKAMAITRKGAAPPPAF